MKLEFVEATVVRPLKGVAVCPVLGPRFIPCWTYIGLPACAVLGPRLSGVEDTLGRRHVSLALVCPVLKTHWAAGMCCPWPLVVPCWTYIGPSACPVLGPHLSGVEDTFHRRHVLSLALGCPMFEDTLGRQYVLCISCIFTCPVNFCNFVNVL